jgi:large subunit ribosomal protein L23
VDIYHTIVRPLVTEKSAHQSRQSFEATRTRPDRGGTFSFEVHPEATKSQIKQAVEKVYGVRVLEVRASNRRGKQRRFRFKRGVTRRWKKAVVVLRTDSPTIEELLF